MIRVALSEVEWHGVVHPIEDDESEAIRVASVEQGSLKRTES